MTHDDESDLRNVALHTVLQSFTGRLLFTVLERMASPNATFLDSRLLVGMRPFFDIEEASEG